MSSLSRLSATALAFAIGTSAASAHIISAVNIGPAGDAVAVHFIPPAGTDITSNFLFPFQTNNIPEGIYFDEQQHFKLTAPLALDTGGVLAAGTIVNSDFIGFNENGNGNNQNTLVTLSTHVLGVEFEDGGNLGASDFLGLPTLLYNTGCANCGYEPGETAVPSGNTVTLNSNFSVPGDFARIISVGTTGVPEPATLAFLGAGLAGLRFARRRASVA